MQLDDPNTSLVLKAVVPDVRSTRGRKYEDLLFMWEQNFACLDVPVEKITEPEEIESLGCIKDKDVFGTKVSLVSASLFLMAGSELVARCGRINAASLQKMWNKALDYQISAIKNQFSC